MLSERLYVFVNVPALTEFCAHNNKTIKVDRYHKTSSSLSHVQYILHQDTERMTTGAGCPVGDKLNSMTLGPRGPVLLQDTVFLDEMSRFDRERIPERVVHAKGSGTLCL